MRGRYVSGAFAGLLMLLFVCGLPVPGKAVLGIHIRNVSLGGGWNAAWKPANYPEVPFYSEPDIKKSFAIDIRLDIPVSEKIRFAPQLCYWSWGSFPKQGTDGPESQLRSFDLNFDLQYAPWRIGRWQPYGGAGIGTHITRHVTQFPLEMFRRVALVVAEISERSLKVGGNLSAGTDFFILPNMAIFQEIRFEYAPGFRQVRLLIGINTF